MAKINEASSAAERRIHDAAMRLYAMTGRTDLSISELANEAGVARGTVYHYIETAETLFDTVTARLTGEMFRRVHKSISNTPDAGDPLARLAMGIRFYVRRAHEEPQWGRFIYSFGFRATVLLELWSNEPTRDIIAGVRSGQLHIPPERLGATMSFIAGVVAAAIQLVSTGHETWRNAGAHAVEFVLLALGISQATACRLANQELPPLLPDD